VDFRARERLVLSTGLTAAGLIAFALLAGIAGSALGQTGNRFVSSVVLLYLCARMWGHGSTLEERGSKELLGRVARLGAPIVLLLLLAQTWGSMSIHLELSGNFLPHLQIGLLTRLEWTADIAVFALFLLTATNVWIEESEGWSALCSRIANVVIVFLSLDLLAGAWGVISLVPQWRLVAALLVLSLAGTVAVAALRRIERLDDLTAES
jgi:hypothetical protein